MNEAQIRDSLEDIAIIGMAGRFPGARNIDEFWSNLRNGVEAITFFSDEELIDVGIDPELLKSPYYVKAGAPLEGASLFDANFFGYSGREAELMDPQQRIFLECAWEALEDACYDPERYTGRIGLFAGTSMNSYLLSNLLLNQRIRNSVGGFQAMIMQLIHANDKDYLATRVSYKLGLRGGSITVQTACSTSLVAACLACQSLLDYRCDIALAGGVSVAAAQKTGYMYQEGGILSPDGHCRAFDDQAQGTVFGNGAGVVVLKRLEDALAAGDQVYAVIKGSAINNDGSAKVGYTAPSVEGQAEVIAEALAVAGVEPESISYIETHGTGTPLGDPIELAALSKAFQPFTTHTGFCAIGSVKTNVGHLNAAAGVTGLIKTVLALKHRELPPSLHFQTPNARIDFAHSPFYVNTQLQPWQGPGEGPLRAGVSSFGIGGTNAHVVLEEAPSREPMAAGRRWQVLVLSTRSEASLERATDQLVEALKGQEGMSLADVAYSLQVGRGQFAHRRMVVCSSREEAIEALERRESRRVFSRVQEPQQRSIVFMFPGGGAQYAGMGADLYEEEGVYREQVDRCAELLRPHLGVDLRELLYPAPDRLEEASKRLEQPSLALPALFAVESALAQLWLSWGVRPQAMIGHSLGEYTAAWLAGVLSLEDALALVALRGRLFEQLPGGGMLSVPLPEAEVRPLLGKDLSLAAINGPSFCVVAGPRKSVRELEQILSERDLKVQALHIDVAAHSEMVTPILDEFTRFMEQVTLHPPTIPYISNVTGTWITDEEATHPHYWAQHLRQTVRFADGIQEFLQDPQWVLLEVGPGQTLSALTRQHPGRQAEQVVLASLRHPQDRRSDGEALFSTLGQLWLAGVEIDWEAFYKEEQRQRISLTTYPFERQRYWIEPGDQESMFTSVRKALRKKRDIADWFYLPSWKRTMPPLLPAAQELSSEAKRWLVFCDNNSLSEQVNGQLRDEGQVVVRVLVGEQFTKLDENSYTIYPGRRDDYDALLSDLQKAGKLPERIIHLWNVSTDEFGPSELDSVEAAEDRGFYSLLHLAKALGKFAAADPLRVEVVTTNVQCVTGQEKLVPVKATVLGPCRVIPQEYPHITCRSVDIQLPSADTSEEKALADQLIAELLVESPDSIIAYRGHDRLAQTFVASRLENVCESTLRLRREGVYLITGGLGGIGMVFAEYLARQVQARLILVGRSVLPARKEWDQWIASHDEHDNTSEKIRAIWRIEQLGGEVLVSKADVTDRAEMQAVAVQAREQFGAVQGIVHAAGNIPGGLIQLKTRQMTERVLAPKVKGALILAELFSDTSLDFFLLCSSLRAIVGGPGHVDHCAANAFLDTFAQYHMATSNTFTVSVNWDSWLDVGQAVNEGGPANGLPHTREASTQPVESRLLIERRVQESADEGVYEAEMNPAQDWVLDEHRLLMGTAVMPGTGYLEIAREAFERQTQQSAVEMQEVTFIAPLIVQDDDHKIVRTTLQKDDSGYMFSIASERSSHDNGHPQWQEHASGHIRALEGKGTGGHEPLSSVINRLRRVEDDDRASALYGPRWRSRREVYLGANEVLAVLELPTEFRGDLDLLKLHPALMDVAVGLGRLAYPELNQGNYIPFSYKRLRMNEPLHGKIYSHSRFCEDAPVDGDVVSYDVTIMDEQGMPLVEIEEFTLRQVHGLESTQSLQGVQRQRAGDVESGERSNNTQNGLKSGIFSQEGVDVFARILSRNTLPQVVVSTRDFPALLEAMSKQFTAERIEDAVEQQVSRSTHARPELHTAFAEPRNEMERQLCNLWQEVLGIDRIGIGDNFFELGGDSVMAIQIATRASKAGLSLNVTQLFEYQNIGELVESCLQQAREGAVGEAAGEVDLRAEAVLDPALRPESQMPESQEVRRIFLTGASGFLGAFLLSELLEATDAEVSCLVRASSVEAGQQKLQKNLENFGIWKPELANRIRVIPGDLSLAALGLSPQQFEALAEQIDVIYHVGALVNWVYPYSVLKGPNVLGTQDILRLASMNHAKPVHYVSTLAVFPSSPQVYREDDSLENTEGLRSAYAQSKWVGEKLIMEAQARGIPASIYRLGRVSGHTQTGACQVNDLFWKSIKACIQAGSVPDVEMSIELVPVDYVTRALVYLSRRPEALGKAFHIFNDHPLLLSDLVSQMRELDYQIKRLKYDEWRAEQAHLFERSSEASDVQALALIFPQENRSAGADGYSGAGGPDFDDQNTREGLAGTDIVCPRITSELLRTYFSYFIHKGFLEAPEQLKVK